MTPLRVVLLLVGALIITALIIWEKRKQRSPNTFRSASVVDDDLDTINTPVSERIEPRMSSPMQVEPVQADPESATGTLTDPATEPPVVTPADSPDESPEEPQAQGWEQLDLEQEAMRLAQDESDHVDTTEPVQFADVEPEPEEIPVATPEPIPATASPMPEELVILYIMAPKDRDMKGGEIQQAMKEAGLQLGEMNLFHYPIRTTDGETSNLFSVADIREPGYFDADRLGSMSTPGLAVFMQLPGPLNGLDALDKMVNVAQQLSDSLYCSLQDERKHELGRTEIENLKEKILKFNLKLHS